MKRRDFSTGLLASSVAGPAFAKKSNEPNVPLRLRIKISLQPGARAIDIRTLLFIDSGGAGLSVSVSGDFSYRNEDRRTIPGLTPPRLIEQIEGADRLASVRIMDRALVIYHGIDRSLDTNLLLGEESTTFLLGGLRRLRKKETDGVPLMSNLPVVGALFRSKDSDEGKRNLTIFISPTIVRES